MDTYKVKVHYLDGSDLVDDYGGGYTADDLRSILKGYKEDKDLRFTINGLTTRFYSRANGKKMFEVIEE